MLVVSFDHRAPDERSVKGLLAECAVRVGVESVSAESPGATEVVFRPVVDDCWQRVVAESELHLPFSPPSRFHCEPG